MMSASLLSQAAAQKSEQDVKAYKQQVTAGVESRAKLAQEMTDSIFSFGELAFQEVETSKYITDILEKNGFTIERGVGGGAPPGG
jgi:aminobenzoyl-glutamate utilization protein B